MARRPRIPATVPDPDTELFSVDEQRLHVKLLLDRIGDERKRKAFELHMEGIPYGGEKGHTIAGVLRISRDTARDWVEDVRAQLAKLVRKP